MSETDVTPPKQILGPGGTGSARLEVRINQIDYVLAPPGELDNSSLPRVPVLRIFGTSSTNQTACVHVHQIYPYFYVEYIGKMGTRHGKLFKNQCIFSVLTVICIFNAVQKYISRLSRSLNHAISVSLQKDPLSPKSRFVRAIVLVKGVHFYGFHSSYSPFLKIYAANPAYVTRMVSILQAGSVMGNRFHVFESHLSYILQFLCDFDLYGCGIISIEDALERCPEDVSKSSQSSQVAFDASPYFRESRLPLEVDIIPPHILNRHRLLPRNLHHRLDTSITELPSDPLILSVRELWEDERKHRQALGLNPSPEIPIDPSESSRDVSAEWISEARWWESIRERIAREHQAQVPDDANEHGWERFVMTTFESVETLWEKQYRVWKPEPRASEYPGQNVKPDVDAQPPDYSWDAQSQISLDSEEDSHIEVDISMFSDQEMNRLEQEEAERWNAEAEHFQLHGDGEENVDEVEEEDTIHEEDVPPGSPDIIPYDAETKSALSLPSKSCLTSTQGYGSICPGSR